MPEDFTGLTVRQIFAKSEPSRIPKACPPELLDVRFRDLSPSDQAQVQRVERECWEAAVRLRQAIDEAMSALGPAGESGVIDLSDVADGDAINATVNEASDAYNALF